MWPTRIQESCLVVTGFGNLTAWFAMNFRVWELIGHQVLESQTLKFIENWMSGWGGARNCDSRKCPRVWWKSEAMKTNLGTVQNVASSAAHRTGHMLLVLHISRLRVILNALALLPALPHAQRFSALHALANIPHFKRQWPKNDLKVPENALQMPWKC